MLTYQTNFFPVLVVGWLAGSSCHAPTGSGAEVMYNDTIHGTHVRVIGVTEGTLCLLQAKEGQLLLTDSIAFDWYAHSLEATDINGDLHTDLLIHGITDMHGQSIPLVLLYQRDGYLQQRPDIQLHNIRFDTATRLVTSYYESGATGLHSKAMYRWEGDSLRLVRRAEMDLTSPRGISIRVFEGNNQLEKKVLDVMGKPDIYDTLLFKR